MTVYTKISELPAAGSLTDDDVFILNDASITSKLTYVSLKTALSSYISSQNLTFSGTISFQGTPTAPTAGAGTNTTQIATTEFVTTAIATNDTSDVKSVNGKTGTVTIDSSDVGLENCDNTSDNNKPISTAQANALAVKSNINDPTFTGTPIAPTATVGTNTTQIATTEFVTTAVSSAGAGVVSSVNTRTGVIVLDSSDVGLGNCDNTSDLDKPVSTATQTALGLKTNSSDFVTLSGRVTTNETDIAAITTPALSAVTAEGATTTDNVSLGYEITSQGDGTNDGRIKLNCSQNSHGVTVQGPPHSQSATYTIILPATIGTEGDIFKMGAGGQMDYASASDLRTAMGIKSGADQAGASAATGEMFYNTTDSEYQVGS